MYPRNQVRVRSSETGREFNISRRVAERHDTLTILDGGHVVEASPEGDEIPAAGTEADQFAAPVADDDEKE